MAEKTAITALAWIPKGKCKPKKPENADGDAEMEDADSKAAEEETEEQKDLMKRLKMDDYDNEDDDDGMQFFQVLKNDGPALGKDQYLEGDPDSDSEGEEYYEIKDDDALFVAVSCEDDICNLEVFLYDPEDCSMYVHHDIMLPAYPLCVEWFTGLPQTHEAGVGNFAAVGYFNKCIDIWDLDDLAAFEPICQLGKDGKAHDDAVMCMNSSPFKKTVLASGGADNAVKLWDCAAPSKPVHVYNFHTDKVQCVKWHPTEQAILLTAAFDKTMALLDVRQEKTPHTIKLTADAESATWGSSSRPTECFVSSEDGTVICLDARTMTDKAPIKPLWTLKAHEKACTSVMQPNIDNMLVTTSIDETAKIWKLNGAKMPKLVTTKELKAGPVFSSAWKEDIPHYLVFGGTTAVLWDLTSDEDVVKRFKLEDRVPDGSVKVENDGKRDNTVKMEGA